MRIRLEWGPIGEEPSPWRAPTLHVFHVALVPATIGVTVWLTTRWWRIAEVA